MEVKRPTIQQPYNDSGLITQSGHLLKLLLGWNATNQSEAASARVLFRNGVGGDVIYDIRLRPGESVGESLEIQNAVVFPDGMYVDITVGTVRGSVRGRT